MIASRSAADLVYTFDQDEFRVAPHQSINIDVYLSQNDPTGDPVDLRTDGLFSGGVRVVFSENPPTEPATISSLLDITPNPLFDDNLLGEELFLEPGVSVGFVDGVADAFSPLKGTRILLGSLRFTAGGRPGDITTLIATDLRPTDDTIAGDPNFTALDDLIRDGLAKITVAAVPEPSSAIFLAIVSCAITLKVMFKKRLAVQVVRK
ncbi:MAG: hypothetical protein KDB23_05765 [Planctomycetales bacterium]|nr:hypothetical protein [Planctomycetales bacterium]